jgi:ER-bound oxygenase mpaB/B'/Rubber oxygenase, catalytic domain
VTGDDAWLSALRTMGDEPADTYVAKQLANVDSKRSEWLTSGIAGLRAVDPPDAAWVTAWEREIVEPPAWMDEDLLRRGQVVFDDWSLDLTTALFCASLPHAYASGRGAAVLASASELYDPRRVTRRVTLTGQMLLDITVPGALRVGAVGYRTLRRVRLLHACVRALLLLGDAAGNPWPTAFRGLPINQQDMMGTQLAFTIAAFEGIERLGYRVSAADKRAYLHLWSVVGHYLGVAEAQRLSDLTEAERLTQALTTSLEQASPWGTKLMQTLLDDMATMMPGPLHSLPAALVRRLAGDEVADLLAVPRSRWAPVVTAVVGVERFVSRASIGRWTLRLPSRLLGRAMIRRSIREGTGAVAPAHYWPDQWLTDQRPG